MIATYNLEGDGPLVLKCFEVLNTLTAGIQVGHYPNVLAIVQSLSAGSPAVLQQWVDYAKNCGKTWPPILPGQILSRAKGKCSSFQSCTALSPSESD